MIVTPGPLVSLPGVTSDSAYAVPQKVPIDSAISAIARLASMRASIPVGDYLLIEQYFLFFVRRLEAAAFIMIEDCIHQFLRFVQDLKQLQVGLIDSTFPH